LDLRISTNSIRNLLEKYTKKGVRKILIFPNPIKNFVVRGRFELETFGLWSLRFAKPKTTVTKCERINSKGLKQIE